VLIRFEASNHRSIMEPIRLSMIAVDEERPAARPFELLGERLLTVAGIYGANASGKSNVLDALSWLSHAARNSLRIWEEAIPRDPFRFGKGPASPSIFDLEMMVAGVRYAYRVELSDEEIIFEGLYSYPERRRRSLFERDGLELRFRRGTVGVGAVRELLTPTTLALSAAMRYEQSEIRDFGRSLANIGVLGARRRGPFRRGVVAFGPAYGRLMTERIFLTDGLEAHQPSLFAGDGQDRDDSRNAAVSLLRFADLGIDDVEVVEEAVEATGSEAPRRSLRLVHRTASERAPFELFDESEGTQTWFRLIGPALRALRVGQTLLLDEIDANLHPRLSARLLELFQDPDTNPYGAQLLFSTHDTSLLNHLNRDEVWLTEKGDDGATRLIALAEFGGDKVRRSLNLEKAYLQGRFGAVPELDQFELRRALGLRDASE